VVGLLAILAAIFALHGVPTGNELDPRHFPPSWPTLASYRHVAAIEREMTDLDPARVLLDVGNWVYLPHNYLARDRAISLADQPLIGMYDNFEPLLRRIRMKGYEKILVHDFDNEWFLYDWPTWRRSSGVRQALRDNYVVARVIPPMGPETEFWPAIQFRGPVSVLVPKPSAAGFALP
jgi:hypothetical protein